MEQKAQQLKRDDQDLRVSPISVSPPSMSSGFSWTRTSDTSAMGNNYAVWMPDVDQDRRIAQGVHTSSDDSGSQTFSSRPSASSGGSTSPAENFGQKSSTTSGNTVGNGNSLSSDVHWTPAKSSWSQDADRNHIGIRTSGTMGPLDHGFVKGEEEARDDSSVYVRGDQREYFDQQIDQQHLTDTGAGAVPSSERWSPVPGRTSPKDDIAFHQFGYATAHGSVTSRLTVEQHQASLESMRTHAHERFGHWAAGPRAHPIVANARGYNTDAPQHVTASGSTFQGSYPDSRRDGGEDQGESFSSGISTAPSVVAPSAESPNGALGRIESTLFPYRSGSSYQQVNSGFGNTVSPFRASMQTQIIPRIENGEHEYSVFVGDLCPDLREEDLMHQFLRPPAWPPSHPLAIAVSNSQQAQGFYGALPRLGPEPFLSTKAATVMTDPLTGASRGYGFVRFSSEADCARALVQMQGVIVQPMSGHGGRPLRVCPATPKNRSSLNAPQPLSHPSNSAMHSLSSSAYIAPLQDKVLNSFQLQQQDSVLANLAYTVPLQSSHTSSLATRNSGNGESLASFSSSALDPNNSTVFVGGLSSLISEETLKTFFAPFGEIKYVKIPPGKGCGFVQFAQKADAERAIERMQGFPIGGGRIRLSWRRSQGDKAVAAATYAAAQAAQIGRLAGLVGLNPSATSQLTAAALNASPSSSSTGSEAHSLLIQRLAAAAQAGLKFDGSGGGTFSDVWSNAEANKEQDIDSRHAFEPYSGSPYRHMSAYTPVHTTFPAESPSSSPEYSTSLWSTQERNETLHRRSRTETDEVLSSMLSNLSFGVPPRRRTTVAEPHKAQTQNDLLPVRQSVDNINTPAVTAAAQSPDQYSTWFASSQLSNNNAQRRSPLPSLPEHDAYSESFNPFGGADYATERAGSARSR